MHMYLIARLSLTAFFTGLLITAMTSCSPKKIEPIPSETVQVEAPVIERVPLPEAYATRTLRTRSNLRAEASTSSPIVTTLDAGTSIGLVSLERGWYRVVTDSTVGWTWAPLVNMTENDQWEAAMSYSFAQLPYDSLFVAKYREE